MQGRSPQHTQMPMPKIGHLVLARHEGEQIFIDCPGPHRITITLERLQGDRAWIGITAPRSVEVLRDNAIITHQKGS